MYAALPSGSAAGTALGRAQPVCLEASTPENCPRSSTRYGWRGGGGWRADLSSLEGAVWIWGPGVSSKGAADLARFVFVRVFDLPRATVGTLKIAVDDFAEVRVNGIRLGSVGSVDDVSVAAAAQSTLAHFDLTPYLVLGKNTISVTAQNGPASYAGCSGTCTYRENPAGVVFGGSLDMCVGTRAPADARNAGNSPGDGAGDGRRHASEVRCTSAATGFGAARSVQLGGWSYGWSATLGSPFIAYQSFRSHLVGLSDGDDLAYRTPEDANHPVAFLNPTNRVRHPGGTFSLQPGQFALHPGPRGEYSIARWRATEPGRSKLEVTFFGLSGYARSPPTTTDVHVLRNGVPLASGTLNLKGSGNSFSYTSPVDLEAGDTIDFAVGIGNAGYECDSTAVDAVICSAPDAWTGPGHER